MNNPLKKISLKDIATEAGVSTALVSFVMNGKGKEHRVSDEKAKLILKIAQDLNYRPNIAAKSLRSGRTDTIGVVLSDISNPFFAQIARGIEDIAAQMGYTVFFGSSDEDVHKMNRLISGLLNKGADGLIIVPCEKSETSIRQLVENNIPIVLLDRPVNNTEASYVALNNYLASYTATSHLIESGRKNTGMIAYDVDLVHMQERIRGYKSAMEAYGLKKNINIGYLKQDAPKRSAGKVVQKILDKKADAIFFATNTISVECLHYINEQRIRIPEELHLVGFDGNEAFELFYSPLTYIQQPIDTLARKVVEVLIDQITNKSSLTQRIEIEGKLIKRSSS